MLEDWGLLGSWMQLRTQSIEPALSTASGRAGKAVANYQHTTAGEKRWSECEYWIAIFLDLIHLGIFIDYITEFSSQSVSKRFSCQSDKRWSCHSCLRLRLSVQENVQRWKIHRLRIIFFPFEMLSWVSVITSTGVDDEVLVKMTDRGF